MLNFKDLADMSKIANQAKELQKQQDIKQSEQINLLNRIADTLDNILVTLKSR